MKPSFRYAMLLGLGLSFGTTSFTAYAANYTTRAQSLLTKGETRAAAIELRNAIKQDPHDGAAHYELAKIDLMLGDAVAAEREARAAKDNGYAAGPALSLLLDTYLAQGRYKDLLRDFPEGSGPADVEARTAAGRGQAMMALGQLDQAKAEFTKSATLAPHATYPLLAEEDLALRQGRITDARAAIARALKIAPHAEPVLLRHASLLLASGDAKGAIAVLDPLRAKAPGDPQVRLALAKALLASGDTARAEKEVKAALVIVPGSAEGTYLQAVFAARKGDFPAADKLLQKLSPVIAHLPQAYLLQAVTKQHLGQLAAAESAAQRFLARFPNDPRGERVLAEIALGAHKPTEALSALAKLPAADRESPATLGLLGRAHAAAGDYADALREFTKAAKLAPHLAEPHADLAALKLRVGDLNGAITEYQEALSIAPDAAAVRRSLIGAEIQAGRYEDAAKNLDTLKKQQGNQTQDALLRGQLQLAKLDLSGAHATYQAILKEHPNLQAAALGSVRATILEGKSAQAKQRLKAMLAKNPANRGALGLFTVLLSTEGDVPGALAAFEHAHGAVPSNAAITADLAALELRRKQPGKALDLLTTSGAADHPAILTLKAQAEIALDKHDVAENTLKTLLARAPGDVGARVTLARLYVHAKDYAAARTALQQGLAQNPRNLTLLQALVGVASAENGLDGGIAEAKKLAAEPAHQPEASVLEGDTYLAQHKAEAAATAYGHAFAKLPSDALVLRLASALQASGKAAEATQKLETYLTQHPDNIPVSLVLASTEIQAGKLDAAAAKLEAVIARQPNNAVALNDLAWIKGEQRQPDALRLAERAYFLSGDSHIADTLGWILSRDKPNQTGVVLLRQAHAATPDDPTVAYHLAVALSHVGETKEATQLLKPLTKASLSFKDKAAAAQLLDKLTSHS